MVTKEQTQKEATHTDENGYLYRVISEKARAIHQRDSEVEPGRIILRMRQAGSWVWSQWLV